VFKFVKVMPIKLAASFFPDTVYKQCALVKQGTARPMWAQRPVRKLRIRMSAGTHWRLRITG